MVTIIAEPDYAPEAVARYRASGPVYHWFTLSKNKKRNVAAQAELLVVRLAINVDRKLMDAMPRLSMIATSTTGLNHIDTAYAEKRGIRVVSLRGETSFLKNIPSTAELTFGFILALLRHIPWAFDDVKKGGWDPNRWTGHELRGKTLGILGLGRLGTLMARYGNAFGMKIYACDPNVSASAMKKQSVRKVDMDTLFKESDIVSLHVLLTDATMGLVRRRHLKLMRPSAYLINTARAELIEHGALYAALSKRWIAGAAIDVLDEEKSDASHLKADPIARYAKAHKNVIIVPHMGGTTYEAKRTTQIFLSDLVFRAMRKR